MTKGSVIKREQKPSKDEQIQSLKIQLADAEANLEAIRSGQADAIVVHTDTGISVFTIQGADVAYRIMVETMNEGAVTVDPEGVILYVNTRFSAMLGIPATSLVGKRIHSFVVDAQKDGFDLFMRKTLAGSSVHQDFELIKLDLSTVPAYMSSAPLEILGRHDICIVVSDLTERNAARGRLIELNSSLEDKVKERTRELEEQKIQLQQSRNDLQKLAQSLEQQVERRTTQVRDLAKALTLAEQKQRQHLSTILHENLQQVLFAVKTRFDLLRDTITSGSTDELESDLKELDSLTTKALDTSKRLAIEFNPPILANEGLDAALHWLAHHLRQRYELEVKVCVPEEFRIIREDERVLLVQLVRELLLNVVKHAKTDIAYVSVERSGNHIHITVEDRGVGFDISAEKKFARERAHMGLFSIEERLRLFGGDLKIMSEPGRGTKVRIILPFSPEDQQLSVE